MSASFNPPDIARFRQRALVVGIVALIVFVVGAFFDPAQFFPSYLLGFTFWFGISVGSLALLMPKHLTGGGWGLVIRRILEAATRTLPLMAVLFIPIILGARRLFPWTNPQRIAESPGLKGKVA